MIEAINFQQLRLRLRPRSVASEAGRPGLRSKVELTLWLCCLALVARLTVFIRRRSTTDFDVVDQFAMIQILIVMVALAVVLLSGRQGLVWRRIAWRASGFLLLYYLFGMVSSLWSPRPAFSLYRAVEVISQFAAIHVALSYSRGFAAAERRALVLILISMAFGMLSVIHMQGIVLNLRYWHTNQYSIPGMFMCLYALGELLSGRLHDRRFLFLIGGAGLVGVVLGTSSGSFIALLAGMLVAMPLARGRGRTLLVVMLLLGAVVALIGASSIQKLVFYGKSDHRIEQMSGRKAMWRNFLGEIAKKPLIGHGFAISARLSSHWRTTNAHNSALSVLLGTGIAGMAVVLLALWRFALDALKSLGQRRPGASGCVVALCGGLVNALSIGYLGEGWMMSTFSFFCMMGLFSMFVASGPRGSASRPKAILQRRPLGRPAVAAP